MMLKVMHRQLWHEKLAPESGFEFRSMTSISRAGFWSMCHRP